MNRTPEQVAADNALTDAIEAVERAYHGESEGVLTTYVVIAKRKFWDEDGTGVTAITSASKDSDVSLDELLGLVEYAAARYRLEIAG